ncbi:MAG: carboxy-S-adenosyl-L-methionine synthase CmoA [Campylobacteraceae bacterium]|nr:carboxy-S-adenosyl-L-methionine synthase CmoA [Campylobacteraceae bacterium]
MDKVFSKPNKKQFEFDEEVASVFDDMLSRSVPLYELSIDFISKFVAKLYPQNAVVVDLGCSTATTLLSLHKQNQNLMMYGFDNSDAMLEMARKKINAFGIKNLTLKNADILSLKIPTNHITIANYMLQFIRPLQRERLVKNIYESLEQGGSFIFSEKIIYEDKTLDKLMIDMYLDFKKSQGYSDFEISQKREALENVLVPYSELENFTMIKNAGFSEVQTLIKWGNFATFLAKK